MVKAIHDPQEFLDNFQVGDTFWTLGCWHGEPVDVDGPIVIHEKSSEMIISQVPSLSEPGELISRERYVADLTNRFHGVLRTEEEAKEYLAEQKAKYATDLKWQASVQESKERTEMLGASYISLSFLSK